MFLFACVVTLLQQNGTWADEPALAPRHLTTVNKKKIVCVLFLTSSQEPVEVFFFIMRLLLSPAETTRDPIRERFLKTNKKSRLSQ